MVTKTVVKLTYDPYHADEEIVVGWFTGEKFNNKGKSNGKNYSEDPLEACEITLETYTPIELFEEMVDIKQGFHRWLINKSGYIRLELVELEIKVFEKPIEMSDEYLSLTKTSLLESLSRTELKALGLEGAAVYHKLQKV